MPGHRVEAVANAFLRRAMADGVTLSNMQVQKLPYIAQGWALALLDRPLVAETPVTFPFGPVYERLYNALREYGAGPVRRLVREGDGIPALYFDGPSGPVIDADFDAEEIGLIDAVWKAYKGFSALQLSALTHQAVLPRMLVRDQAGARQPIPNEVIKAHYLALVAERKAARAAA